MSWKTGLIVAGSALVAYLAWRAAAGAIEDLQRHNRRIYS